ncbi:uncharacterized protein EDB93DRAFT_1237838 [Suillus bovinus]|uniref:uncharacterized protein n=1 Tax=Suillus bovinus TaxID=48563 RepID=UPI001B86A4E7|nr:uncharacterized protein EDB93DRAFT_1237838 [Suillus bovinus]KAG2159097.1 hypothetical protein EDB93DRAFT_1237838 [Suillus bovinus]
MFLWMYVDQQNPRTWTEASRDTAQAHQKAAHTARLLCKWARSFVEHHGNLPMNLYGSWNVSLLDKGDLAEAIHRHLQSIGKYVRAQDIVDYLAQPNVQQKHGLKKTISLATAQQWMHMMDFRWTKSPSGQYVDGHERDDVVTYRQKKFLLSIAELFIHMRTWKDGLEEASDEPRPHTQLYWVHGNETAKPRPKGEGASLMVADFVSADYGWLRSSCGEEAARILFRAGKSQDSYFTNASILRHAELAMDILDRHYPHDQAFERTMIGSDGKPVHGADGKALNEKVRMADGVLPDGSAQCFYFPEGHARAGRFKGMAEILKERGFEGCKKLRVECPNFRCNPNINRCCCRRLLYNQPDFLNVKSNIELACEKRGYKVLFLPKFHCELNFIEQCWGFAKHHYRQLPPSSSEAVLMQNIIDSLEAVPLVSMRKFATRSLRFMDAYRKGLNGKQAAFATKKYRGHRTLPLSVFDDLA